MTTGHRIRGNSLAWMLTLTGIWGWIWLHLAIEWKTNAQYQYGLTIPFLFIYLAMQQWHGVFLEHRAGRWMAWAVASAWMLFLFGELLRQHDPIWRLTGGTLMLSATAMTIIWLYRAGGQPLVARLAFPLLFSWLALPWPVPVELFVTQNLLRILTNAAVIILNLFHVAALQRGNVIELSNGLVGMDMACSGVQSFQASLVATLFFGEFYRLGWMRRIGLVLAGAAVALVMNFGRILFLTFSVHIHGENAIAQYHDHVGYVASIATFSLVFLLAAFLKPRNPATEEAVTSRSDHVPALAGLDGYAVLAAFFCIPFTAWTWFAMATSGPLKTRTTPQWTLQTTPPAKNWRVENLPDVSSEHAMLQYSERQALLIKNPSGAEMRILHFFWKPGKSMPYAAFYHTPQMCMPWAGWEPVAEPTAVLLTIRGIQLPCVRYRFRQDNTQQTVYQALCAGGRPAAFMLNPHALADRLGRLSMLWRSPREQVNEELLIYLSDGGNQETQQRLVEEMLPQILAPDSGHR